MEKKRRISIRKVLQASLTLVLATGCTLALLSASKRQQKRVVSKVDIEILGSRNYQFLDKKQLWKNLIDGNKIEVGKTAISTLNISKIEKEANQNIWVGKSMAYLDNNYVLHIKLTPRHPEARIFFENGQSFYLDSTLRLLPLSYMNTYYTVVVTNMPLHTSDSVTQSLRYQALKLVKFIEKDTFWTAQIDQISVTPNFEFELMPVMGTHRILFGDTTRMAYKFNKLFGFYKTVLNRIGWDKYETLDLRNKNQIVAAPSIPWKKPAGNTLSNMGWLKNMMEEVNENPANFNVNMLMTGVADSIKKETKQPVQVALASPKKEPAKPTAQKEKPKEAKAVKAEPAPVTNAPKYIYSTPKND